MTENSRAMQKQREYNRLIVAILENKPKSIIDQFAYEYADSGDIAVGLEMGIDKIVKEAKQDSSNYLTHYQGSRAVLVLKSSPLGKILLKRASDYE